MNSEKIFDAVIDFMAKTGTTAAVFSFVGVLLLIIAKMTSHPQLTWTNVFTPLIATVATAIALSVTLFVVCILASLAAFVIGIALGRFFLMLNRRREQKALANKLSDAEQYDAEAIKSVQANTPLSDVGRAMGNVAQQLTNFNRPYDHRQGDRRL